MAKITPSTLYQRAASYSTQATANYMANEQHAAMVARDAVHIEYADSRTCYAHWPRPTVIVSDGPYGLGLFPGDPPTLAGLQELYMPHIEAWAQFALPETTLWFWCSEIGWATIHPALARHGWVYRNTHVWNKGIGHIAGNVNSKTIRKFPVVTELCVQYVRDVRLPTGEGLSLSLQPWLRHEWLRAGLPLAKTNEVCGVKNAATRKYFTADHLWYFPPSEMMERLVAYANEHGKADGRPYFTSDGVAPVTANQWSRMRAKWNHIHAVTNVWEHPAIRGKEREKDKNARTLHANQKPLALMRRIIEASSDPGDVIWEPFGGLCTGAIASYKAGRACYSAEINPAYYHIAVNRLLRTADRTMTQGLLFRERSLDDTEDEDALAIS